MIAVMSFARASASEYRWVTSLAKHRLRMLSIAGESEGTRTEGGSGSLLMSWKRILVTLSPSKAGTPVSIS
jgi:hypothetical protein